EFGTAPWRGHGARCSGIVMDAVAHRRARLGNTLEDRPAGQSTVIAAALATLPKRSYSVWVSVCSSAALEPFGLKPAWTSLSRTPGRPSASTNAVLSACTPGADSLAGP